MIISLFLPDKDDPSANLIIIGITLEEVATMISEGKMLSGKIPAFGREAVSVSPGTQVRIIIGNDIDDVMRIIREIPSKSVEIIDGRPQTNN